MEKSLPFPLVTDKDRRVPSFLRRPCCGLRTVMISHVLLCFAFALITGVGWSQVGIDAIQRTMARERRVYDAQIDWSLIQRLCPVDSSWTLHLPSLHPTQPLDQSAFVSGRFEMSLYAARLPKIFLRRRPLLVYSLVFDNNDRLIGGWDLGSTGTACNSPRHAHAPDELLAEVYHDSVPSAMGIIHWDFLNGYVYKMRGTWYMITHHHGTLRHEPFLTLLREHWAMLVANGKYAKGPWLDD